MRTRSIAGVFAVFTLVILVLVSCIHLPIAGLSVELPPIEGPGRFEIKIIVINATLVGSIACDNGVTITPSSLPYMLGDQEITPAILEIPPSFPEGMATCFVPTSAKRFPFTIWVGPPGPPTCHVCIQFPLRLSKDGRAAVQLKAAATARSGEDGRGLSTPRGLRKARIGEPQGA